MTDTTAPEPGPYELTDRDLEILAFEGQWWKYPAVKETAMRERFAMSPARYYQVLNYLLDQPAALAAEPMTVRRLLRVREETRRKRTRSSTG